MGYFNENDVLTQYYHFLFKLLVLGSRKVQNHGVPEQASKTLVVKHVKLIRK